MVRFLHTFVLFGTLLLAGCPRTENATQILVVVRSDLQVGDEIDAVEVRLLDPDQLGDDSRPDRSYALAEDPDDGRYAVPLSFSVRPKQNGSNGDFRVVVTGLKAGDVVVEQQALASFVPHKSLVLELYLARSCLDRLCRDGEGHRTGRACDVLTASCQTVRESEDLPVWQGPGTELDAGPGSGSGLDADVSDGEAEDAEPEGDGEPGEGGPSTVECDPGYRALGSTCADIDECALNTTLCGEAECRNRPGGYACGECETGFAPGRSGSCVDINECTVGSHNCDPNADCGNIAGSFECRCRLEDGYAGGGTTCSDFDECANPADHDCDTMPMACANRSPAEGRYVCACPAGYSGSGRGASGCLDINECTAPSSACDADPIATCTNSIGEFMCACPNEHRGDGRGAQGCVPLLRGISLSWGTLSPSFSPMTNEYTADMGVWQTDVSLYLNARPGVSLFVEDTALTAFSYDRTLSLGANQLPVRVSAGDASNTYTLTLTRGPVTDHALKPAFSLGMGSYYGEALALSADGTVAAVASAHAFVSETGFVGAVQVFRRVGTTWEQEAVLRPFNPSNGDRFGYAVSMSADGTRIAVGAPDEASSVDSSSSLDDAASGAGAVYVFQGNARVWSHGAYLKARNIGAGDGFGSSVSLSADGRWLAAGAPGESSSGLTPDELAMGAGAVYVFELGTTLQTFPYSSTFIKAASAGSTDAFGTTVALSNDGSLLAVGAPGEDASNVPANAPPNEDAIDSGAVYTFKRAADSTWSQVAYTKAANAGAGDRFGIALAMTPDANILLVGAPGEDSSTTGRDSTPDEAAADSGAVYRYYWSSNAWSSHPIYLKPMNTGAGDRFGTAVAMSSNGMTIVVGAPGEDSSSTGINSQPNESSGSTGAAYLFRASDWNQQAYIKRSAQRQGDEFGDAVALDSSGEIVVVGVHYGGGGVGAAHVYQ